MKHKKEKMLLAMDLVDEKYVDEANPEKMRKKKAFYKLEAFGRKHGKLIAVIAASLTALNLFLFIPYRTTPPGVSAYQNSEYYTLIEQLNQLTFSPPEYKNNFEKIFSVFFSLGKGTTIEASPTDTYQEITDNQVDGIIEADRIKRSDRYIYYLQKDTLKVYTIAGADSAEVGSYRISGGNYCDEWEFYLSQDCKTVTVIAPTLLSGKNGGVKIISLDVADPANIVPKKEVTISGGYLSSRLVDGKILLLTQFTVGNDPDFSDESQFLPQIDTGDGMESIPPESIITPETLTSPRYTVVCKLDEETLSPDDCSAFLSYSDDVYVSDNNVYAIHEYTEDTKQNGLEKHTNKTEITAISYTDEAFAHIGSVVIDGWVKNQYSLDEYDGILRVVTSTYYYQQYRDEETGYTPWETGENAALYCIDLSTWKVVASVDNFAPEGETVESVRFDGNAAYVCTAVVVTFTDPVYFFDLSDLSSITYKDTGTIEGYSTSLVDFGDGYLLGIGYGSTSSTLKIEIYEETETGVRSVCAYEMPNTSYAQDYKSYYIDRENRYIGLGITNQYTGNGSYMLLEFDGYDLRTVLSRTMQGDDAQKRSVCIDGYCYIFWEDGFITVPLE